MSPVLIKAALLNEYFQAVKPLENHKLSLTCSIITCEVSMTKKSEGNQLDIESKDGQTIRMH